MSKKATSIFPGIALGLLVSAILAGVIGAVSQNQTVAPGVKAPAPTPASTPASTNAAGITDAQALAFLSQFIGTWNVEGYATGADGTTTGPFRGESQFGWTLGGTFLAGDHVLWNAQGSALQTMDVMGFTPNVGFTRSEITNGDRSMFLSTGMYDSAINAIVFSTSNSLLTVDGKSRALDTSFIFRPDGAIVWNTSFDVDDAPAGSVKLTLTRASATPGLSSPQTPFGAPMIAQQAQSEQPAKGAQSGGAANSGSFIVQTPQGMAVTRPPQNAAEQQQLLAAMMKQRQQVQAQMNTMQGQVQDLSRTMSSGTQQ